MSRGRPGLGRRAPRRTAYWAKATAIVIGVASVAGCGSSSDTPGRAETAPTTSSAPTVAQQSPAESADAACATYLEVIASNGPLPIPGFDPDHPEADQLPAVGAHFAPAVEAAERQAQALRSVADGQPEGSRLARYVDALEAENANSRAQVDAARAGDVEGFTATLGHVQPLQAARIEAATQLGAPRCAEP